MSQEMHEVNSPVGLGGTQSHPKIETILQPEEIQCERQRCKEACAASMERVIQTIQGELAKIAPEAHDIYFPRMKSHLTFMLGQHQIMLDLLNGG